MDYIQIGIIILIALGAINLIILVVKQPKKVKEWLLWAVAEAEGNLGGKTGKLKLRKVYDAFVARFKVVSFLVSFETFADWVDVALDEMRELLETNPKAKAVVENGLQKINE